MEKCAYKYLETERQDKDVVSAGIRRDVISGQLNNGHNVGHLRGLIVSASSLVWDSHAHAGADGGLPSYTHKSSYHSMFIRRLHGEN